MNGYYCDRVPLKSDRVIHMQGDKTARKSVYDLEVGDKFVFEGTKKCRSIGYDCVLVKIEEGYRHITVNI